MQRRDRNLRILFGLGLALATFLTRYPIHASTLFEFDSINFAVGTFRFDLVQVAPQMPGYILHLLLGRVLYAIIGDIHLAYVWLSILLSIGSVLFLWRAAVVLRGERVGVIAALLWLTLPLFWFHGAVDAIYTEEAFWTSVLLYFGLRIITKFEFRISNKEQRYETLFVGLFAIGFSLAGAARPNDLLFFFPAILYVLWKTKPRKNAVIIAAACFAVVTALWVAELLYKAGGLAHYLSLAASESNFKTQSILFGNGWRSQLDLMGKVLFDFVIALGPLWILLLVAGGVFAKHSNSFVRHYARNTKAQFVFLIAIVPLGFYFVVFFMKAGYLLNVLPSAILACAVLLDQVAIWIAETVKRRFTMRLTRPIITKYALLMTGGLVILNILWVFVPWPGTQQSMFDNEDTRNSFIHGAVNRYEHSMSPALTLANRTFEYTNVSGIRAVDSLNNVVLRTLQDNYGNDSGEVILASWWYRWAYILFPHATVYDLELNPHHPDSLWVGRSQELNRDFLDHPADSVIHFRSSHPVLLLLRHDRPDFDTVAYQVHLERLPLPEYLDIYRVLDTSFTLKWHDRTFVKEP